LLKKEQGELQAPVRASPIPIHQFKKNIQISIQNVLNYNVLAN